MSNHEKSRADVLQQYCDNIGIINSLTPQSLAKATEKLAPQTNDKPNYELLMWRVAYLLRHLEESEDSDKATKRKQLGSLALYLRNEKNIDPLNCHFPGAKSAAGLLVKAAEFEVNKNPLYTYLVPSHLLPKPSLLTRLSWLSPIKEWNVSGIIQGLSPWGTIGLASCIAGAALFGFVGVAAPLAIAAGIGLATVISAIFIGGSYQECKTTEHEETVKSLTEDLSKEGYEASVLGTFAIIPEQRNAVSLAIESKETQLKRYAPSEASSAVATLSINSDEASDNKSPLVTYLEDRGKKNTLAQWKTFSTELKLKTPSPFWSVGQNDQPTDLTLAQSNYLANKPSR